MLIIFNVNVTLFLRSVFTTNIERILMNFDIKLDEAEAKNIGYIFLIKLNLKVLKTQSLSSIRHPSATKRIYGLFTYLLTFEPISLTYLKPLIEIYPMSMSIYKSIFYLRSYTYYKSQLAMWTHYWHTQTQIWIENAMTDG
jgi:hypothetical protein